MVFARQNYRYILVHGARGQKLITYLLIPTIKTVRRYRELNFNRINTFRE